MTKADILKISLLLRCFMRLNQDVQVDTVDYTIFLEI